MNVYNKKRSLFHCSDLKYLLYYIRISVQMQQKNGKESYHAPKK